MGWSEVREVMEEHGWQECDVAGERNSWSESSGSQAPQLTSVVPSRT